MAPNFDMEHCGAQHVTGIVRFDLKLIVHLQESQECCLKILGTLTIRVNNKKKKKKKIKAGQSMNDQQLGLKNRHSFTS